jgi:hypothetical protein
MYSSPYEYGHTNKIYGTHSISKETPKSVASSTPSSITPPYDTIPIMNVDDYEYSMVAVNEGQRDISPATRKMLLSSYPMDWTMHPPSSSYFEQGLATFKESFQNPSTIPNIYGKVDGSNMIPPDLESHEQKEREMMSTYTPKNPSSLTTYDAADAKELVDKIYAAKGKRVSMKEVGNNVFSITSVHDLTPPQEEDVAPATSEASSIAGENTIVLPQVTYSAKGMDPFFTPNDPDRLLKTDYTAWTPGLERQFAPNQTMEHWY